MVEHLLYLLFNLDNDNNYDIAYNFFEPMVNDERHIIQSLLMMPFSTGTGLERVGIVGPELELPLGRSLDLDAAPPLQKQETKGDR